MTIKYKCMVFTLRWKSACHRPIRDTATTDHLLEWRPWKTTKGPAICYTGSVIMASRSDLKLLSFSKKERRNNCHSTGTGRPSNHGTRGLWCMTNGNTSAPTGSRFLSGFQRSVWDWQTFFCLPATRRAKTTECHFSGPWLRFWQKNIPNPNYCKSWWRGKYTQGRR